MSLAIVPAAPPRFSTTTFWPGERDKEFVQLPLIARFNRVCEHPGLVYTPLLIATDTPAGSGIMPLGMMYMITYLASLTDMPVESAIAAATGNNARGDGLNSGFLHKGRDADVVVIDACVGGSKDNALDALRNGDIAAVAAVVTDGVPRFVGRSRNTPAPNKTVRVTQCRIPQDYSLAAH